MADNGDTRLRLAMADLRDREKIYRIRHEIYATELGQHAENPDGMLRDALDDHNVYVIATMGGDVAGFVSITPPDAPSYSLDKYVSREELPFECDDRTYEVRLLTVREPYRGLPLAFLLLYAAFRWIEDRGGYLVFGIGRDEIKQIYAKIGADPTGIEMQSGAVNYELMYATAPEYRERVKPRRRLIKRLEERVDWRLDVPFRRTEPCFHGGAFFDAVGEGFDDLSRRHTIINADVLDAWFDPSPAVTDAFREHLAWLARTSPPVHCAGMVEAISSARGVPASSVLPGAGSSSLIFRTFGEWLTRSSRALILDPMYGEYEHALRHVIGCEVDRFGLSATARFDLDVEELGQHIKDSGPYDLVVIVNPNSPTGRHTPREDLESLLRFIPPTTKVWIDETYVEYVGDGESLESFASSSLNVVVCKSMSKTYALSGLRVGYLCGPAQIVTRLRANSPPWSVSLPGQLAAVKVLGDPSYYAECYRQTHEYRNEFAGLLAKLDGVTVFPSTTNFLLLALPEHGPDAATVVDRCRQRGVFLRDASAMGLSLGKHALRTAVKQPRDNERIAEAIGEALDPNGGTPMAQATT